MSKKQQKQSQNPNNGKNNSKVQQAQKKSNQNQKPSNKINIDVKSVPVSKNGVGRSSAPKFMGKPNEPVIDGKEFILACQDGAGDLFAVLARFRLNPASQATFPWLSKLASNFEFYKFEKLVFHYINRTNSTNSGQVMLVPDFDAADAAPLNEIEAMQNYESRECAIWRDTSLICSPKALNALYKRRPTMDDTRFATSSQDEKTIDAGQVFILTDGTSTANVWGKIWVEYTVRFYMPQPTTFPPFQMGGGGFEQSNNLNVSTTSTSVFGAPSGIAPQSDIRGLVQTPTSFPTNDILKFTKDFQGLLDLQVQGSGITGIPDLTVNGVVNNNTSTLSSARTTGLNNYVQSSGTKAGKSYDLNLKAGDVINFVAGQMNGTAVTNILMDFASRTPF